MAARLMALVLLTLASLAATADPAAACRLHSRPDAEGRWVVNDGKRKIGYRLSGRPHPRFELQIEKSGPLADPRIVCRDCPAGATLGLVWQFSGASEVPPMYLTPEALGQELEHTAPSKRMKIRPMSDQRGITLEGLRGWAMPFEHRDERPSDFKFAVLNGYLSDGCASIVLVADTNPVFGGGPSPIWLPADEIMRLLGEMLQSITVTRVDP